MRKSQSRTGVRKLRAGIAISAASAVMIAAAATPAFGAVTTVTLQSVVGPIGGGVKIVAGAASSAAFDTYVAVKGRTVASTATCPTTFGTTGTEATVSNITTDSVDVTLPALAAGAYKICLYGVTTGEVVSGTAQTHQGHANVTINAANTRPKLSTPAGPSTGATITATGSGPYLASVTGAPGVLFNTTTCPATYTATGNIAATAVKTSTSVATITVPATLSATATYNVCVYASTSGALLGQGDRTYVVRPAVTVSPAQGSEETNTTLAVSSTTAYLANITPGVTFSRTACPAKYTVDADNIAGTNIMKISNYKVAVKTTTGLSLLTDEAVASYNVCIYNGAAADVSTIITSPGSFKIAPVLSVTGVSSSTPGGPSQGGTLVTIQGTGFPTAADALLTADLGGSKVIIESVKSDGTEIYGTTTAHSAETALATVTTAAGTKTATTNGFVYSYGITVAPNTDQPYGVSATNPTLDILGAGFAELEWGDPADGSTAPTGAGMGYVFLVNNSWFNAGGGSPAGATGGSAKNAGLIAQCTGVTLISDNEIICTLELNHTFETTGYTITNTVVPAGAYSVVVVNDISNTTLSASTDFSRVSSGATFTVAEY